MAEEKNIQFRGSEEYRERLQRAALDRHLKVQQLLEQAVEAFLATPVAQRAAAPPIDLSKYPEGRERLAHELLEIILNRGSPDQVDWITGNLRTFVEAIRARPIPPTDDKNRREAGLLAKKIRPPGKPSRKGLSK